MERDWGIYLAGDSYPADRRTEAEIRYRVAPSFARWTNQRDLVAASDGGRFSLDIDDRLRLLDRVLTTAAPAVPPVLFGRSSGARVATLYACERPVSAVICLGYPFRRPGAAVEPARVAHLATMTTPVLILQGEHDIYGAADTTSAYALSPTIAVRPVPCGHEIDLPPDGYARLAREIDAFLDAF